MRHVGQSRSAILKRMVWEGLSDISAKGPKASERREEANREKRFLTEDRTSANCQGTSGKVWLEPSKQEVEL